MKYKVIKLGKFKLVSIITLAAVLLAVILDVIFYELLNNQLISNTVYIARSALIPLIITPTLAWFLADIIFELNYLEKKMSRLATYDYLTKLLNRRGFYDSCKVQHDYAVRNKLSYAILSVDLDLFKMINDTYGHATGDHVLEHFAKISRNLSRKSDFIGRVGGEEFIFFLTDTDREQAEKFAARLLTSVRQETVTNEDQQIKYTISGGISINRCDINAPSHLDTILRQADKALYMAKNNGRDQVVIL